MTVCVMLSLVTGGKMLGIVPWLTTASATQRSLIWRHSCVSGLPLWNLSLVNVVCLIDKQVRYKQLKMDVGMQIMSSELTRAVKSYLGRISSATLQKLLYVLRIPLKIWNAKSVWQLFWELSNQPSPSFRICERCGLPTQKKSGCSVCHSQG